MNATSEDLASVMREVVTRCANHHVAVSEVLAAFIVRTVSPHTSALPPTPGRAS
jgi:hypothetical protein